MAARVREAELAGMRWLGVTGDRHDVFAALGAAARHDVTTVLDDVLSHGTRARATAEPELVERVLAASRKDCPLEVAEAEALAEGARVDAADLLLANVRGDIGHGDGTGCSDLGWRRRRSFVAHNEDGGAATNLTVVTLAVDGEPPVAVEWYPGFVPANSFVVSGHGLVWGIDHIAVQPPHPGPGRHFVGRTLRHCRSLDEVAHRMTTLPSAGGFAYTVGEFGTGRVATVETAAGNTATVHADPHDRPLLWHTNHVRYVEAADTRTSTSSEARGCVLDALEPPEQEPDVDWFLGLLAGPPPPDGVRQPRGDGGGMTLCTAVVDLDDRAVTFQPADGGPQTIPVETLLAGP